MRNKVIYVIKPRELLTCPICKWRTAQGRIDFREHMKYIHQIKRNHYRISKL